MIRIDSDSSIIIEGVGFSDRFPERYKMKSLGSCYFQGVESIEKDEGEPILRGGRESTHGHAGLCIG